MMSVANLRRDIVFLTVARLKRLRMLKALNTESVNGRDMPRPYDNRKNTNHIVRVRNDELHGLICELVASEGLTYQAAFEQIINGIFDGQSSDASTEAESNA